MEKRFLISVMPLGVEGKHEHMAVTHVVTMPEGCTEEEQVRVAWNDVHIGLDMMREKMTRENVKRLLFSEGAGNNVK